MQKHAAEQTAGGFLPHGFCYLWKPELLWFHVISDVVIGVAYMVISFTLIRMVWKNRNEFPFQHVFVAFSLFIVACGLTHFVEVYTLWKPAYWWSGAVKAVTALASLGTAALLPPLIPGILSTIQQARLSEERRREAERAEARTESLAAEAQLGKSRLEAVLQALPVGVFITDAEGMLVMTNPAALDIWAGRPPQFPVAADSEYRAWRLPDRSPVQPEEWPVARALRSGGTIPAAELEIQALDGSRRVILASAAVFNGEDARVLGAVGVHVDITARREIEDRLQSAQKLEVVGQLASGIAHEFNSLLTGIHARAEFQLDGLAETDAAWADANEIRQAAVRASGLTRRLVALGQREIVQPRALDLNHVVGHAMPQLQALLSERISLSFSLRSGPVWIRGDRNQIEQAVLHLVMNSRDAISGEGTISIQTRSVHLPQKHDDLPVPPGPYIELTITDSGTGMEEATHRRVFEPFFTTKTAGAAAGVGLGLGLGLATVRAMVTQYGGFISIESAPGEGTRVVLLFPSLQEEVTPAPRPQVTATAEKQTILVVEDQDDVRSVIRRVLEKGNFEVLSAASADEAITLFNQADGAISLLITDVMMPGMSGLELANHLHLLNPCLPIVFISGYTEDEIMRQGLLPDNSWFLEKPFSNKALVDKVHEAFDSLPLALPG